ncbi:MAG: class II glutamine amidotransferase [Frankiaceae bacterium]|nr:class II glutamine amidotransferase [Arenimonas sp.]
MCELLAMSSRRSTQLNFSLQTLAAHSGSASTTRDGWGVAFYQGNDVALFREPMAANDSPLVRFLQSQGLSTILAISHIRHATRGALDLSNTQPFLREFAGRMHVFAHNGNLPGIDTAADMAFDRYRPVGTTDSEHAFCALLERLHGLWKIASTPPTVQERRSVVAAFAADLCKLGPANFPYADGEVLFAHGHRRIQAATGRIVPPGLFLMSCHCPDPQEPVHANGVTVAPGFQEMVLVASVPLSGEGWRPLDEGELVAVSAGRIIDGTGL